MHKGTQTHVRQHVCAFVQRDTQFYLVEIKYLIGWSYFRDRATLHLLMRNLKFYEIRALSESVRKSWRELIFGRRNWVKRDPRVLLPVSAEISRSRESSVRTADNDWKQRQRNAAPHRWSLQWLIVSWPFYYFDVYTGTRDRFVGRMLTQFSNNQSRSYIFSTHNR